MPSEFLMISSREHDVTFVNLDQVKMVQIEDGRLRFVLDPEISVNVAGAAVVEALETLIRRSILANGERLSESHVTDMMERLKDAASSQS